MKLNMTTGPDVTLELVTIGKSIFVMADDNYLLEIDGDRIRRISGIAQYLGFALYRCGRLEFATP